MSTEFRPGDSLLDSLSADLAPVRRRSVWRDALSLLAIAAIELLLIMAFGGMRPDLANAMATPSFWWKLASFALLAGIGTATAVRSLDPAHSPRRGLRWIVTIVGAALVLGWAVDSLGAGGSASGSVMARVDWRQGMGCLVAVSLLSIPFVAGFGLLVLRGAPTDRAGTALASGIAGAACGTLLFCLHCPHDDPLYIAVWYGLACGIITLLGRLLLPRLIRW